MAPKDTGLPTHSGLFSQTRLHLHHGPVMPSGCDPIGIKALMVESPSVIGSFKLRTTTSVHEPHRGHHIHVSLTRTVLPPPHPDITVSVCI